MSNSTDDADLHLRARDELASLALGETAPERVDEHVRGCIACQAELGRLIQVVALAREGGREPDDRPAQDQAQTWARIAALTGDAPAGDTDDRGASDHAPHDRAPHDRAPHDRAPAKPDDPLAARRSTARRRWRPAGLVAAAAVALTAAGFGGWAVGHTSSPGPARHAAIAELSAQPGTSARAAGTATMHPEDRGYAMDVRTSGLPAPTGFYEVWLYDPDANRMVAVGTLGPGAHGTFTLPAGIDVARYRVVDVSAQRFDGDPRHQRSVLQGPLDR